MTWGWSLESSWREERHRLLQVILWPPRVCTSWCYAHSHTNQITCKKYKPIMCYNHAGHFDEKKSNCPKPTKNSERERERMRGREREKMRGREWPVRGWGEDVYTCGMSIRRPEAILPGLTCHQSTAVLLYLPHMADAHISLFDFLQGCWDSNSGPQHSHGKKSCPLYCLPSSWREILIYRNIRLKVSTQITFI